MARFVIKNGHSKTCDLMRLDYVLKYRHQFRSMLNSELNWLGGPV